MAKNTDSVAKAKAAVKLVLGTNAYKVESGDNKGKLRLASAAALDLLVTREDWVNKDWGSVAEKAALSSNARSTAKLAARVMDKGAVSKDDERISAIVAKVNRLGELKLAALSDMAKLGQVEFLTVKDNGKNGILRWKKLAVKKANKPSLKSIANAAMAYTPEELKVIMDQIVKAIEAQTL